ncbi:MAG: four helix bundle protein [Chloroflexi bacterium]|nr:four helix bundle protein [Chloroflexota bacterium]
MRDFKKIRVWQKAHTLTLKIYKATAKFPDDERFGLKSQLRRAMASVPTNIAEGAGRETQSDFARFVHIATGSTSEVEYLLLLSHELGYLLQEEYAHLEKDSIEIKRMLYGFGKALRK